MPATNQAPLRAAGATYCPDCTAARLSRIHLDHPAVPAAAEPTAPPLPAAGDGPSDQCDLLDADGTGPTGLGLGRRPSSPPVVAARCYRYIASSSSSYRGSQGRSSVGRCGSSRSYFRSLVPGGDAFPVPPPAYDDS